MEFPLLKLPFLAVQEVLENAEFSDLIHFSFTSKRSNWCVKSLRKPANRELNVLVHEFGITITTRRTFEIGWKIFYEVEKGEGPITTVMDGFEMRTLSLDGSLYSLENLELKKCALIAINYLKDLFRCLVNGIALFPDRMPHSIHSSLNLPIKCRSIYITGRDGLSYDKLWEILEDTEVTLHVYTKIPIIGNPRNDSERWTICNKFTSEDSKWITKEMVCNMKCWDIIFKYTRLTPEDCGYIINRWFNSNKTLYLLKLHGVIWGPDGITFESLGLEMPLMPYDGKRRKKDFLLGDNYTIDFSNALDILRGDGTLASVWIYTGGLYFGVWRNPIEDNDGKIVLKDPPTVNNV